MLFIYLKLPETISLMKICFRNMQESTNSFQADLYSGAVFINQSLELNIFAGVAILLAMALIFNGFGKCYLITK